MFTTNFAGHVSRMGGASASSPAPLGCIIRRSTPSKQVSAFRPCTRCAALRGRSMLRLPTSYEAIQCLHRPLQGARKKGVGTGALGRPGRGVRQPCSCAHSRHSGVTTAAGKRTALRAVQNRRHQFYFFPLCYASKGYSKVHYKPRTRRVFSTARSAETPRGGVACPHHLPIHFPPFP